MRPRNIVPLLCLLLLSANATHAEKHQGEASFDIESAVTLALANNPVILEATENLAAEQETVKAARADSLPTLSTSYAYTRMSDAPYATFNGTRVLVGSRDNYAWDIKITQPLFTGFTLSTKVRLAELGVDISKVAHKLAILELIKKTKSVYYEILRQKQLLGVSEETVAQLTAHLDDANNFYRQDLIPYNDLLKSQVALSNATQQQLQQQSNLEMTVSGFNSLLKLPLEQPTEFIEVPPPPDTLPDLVHLQEAALADRPESQALQLAVLSSEQQVRLARSPYYPEVGLEGRYLRNGDNPTATNNDYANDHNATVGVKATWTLFDWGKKRDLVNRQMHERNALTEQLEETRDGIRLDVKQSWLHFKVAGANIRTAESARKQAEENFRITRLQYQQNLATSSDVIDARAMLSTAEANACNAKYDLLQAQAEVNRAIGFNDHEKRRPPQTSMGLNLPGGAR